MGLKLLRNVAVPIHVADAATKGYVAHKDPDDVVLRYYKTFTSKLGVGGLTQEVTKPNTPGGPYNTLKIHLKEYTLQPDAGVTINSAFEHF
jgi:hypothetical protein